MIFITYQHVCPKGWFLHKQHPLNKGIDKPVKQHINIVNINELN